MVSAVSALQRDRCAASRGLHHPLPCRSRYERPADMQHSPWADACNTRQPWLQHNTAATHVGIVNSACLQLASVTGPSVPPVQPRATAAAADILSVAQSAMLLVEQQSLQMQHSITSALQAGRPAGCAASRGDRRCASSSSTAVPAATASVVVISGAIRV